MFRVFFHLFCCFVEKSNIVGEPEVNKIFSVDIDSFRDVCFLKYFLHDCSE